MLTFTQYANQKHPCRNCGCPANHHRGGAADDDRHDCPAHYPGGYAKPFPRTTYLEDRSGDYTAYWTRVEAYWSEAGSEYRPAASQRRTG